MTVQSAIASFNSSMSQIVVAINLQYSSAEFTIRPIYEKILGSVIKAGGSSP